MDGWRGGRLTRRKFRANPTFKCRTHATRLVKNGNRSVGDVYRRLCVCFEQLTMRTSDCMRQTVGRRVGRVNEVRGVSEQRETETQSYLPSVSSDVHDD